MPVQLAPLAWCAYRRHLKTLSSRVKLTSLRPCAAAGAGNPALVGVDSAGDAWVRNTRLTSTVFQIVALFVSA